MSVRMRFKLRVNRSKHDHYCSIRDNHGGECTGAAEKVPRERGDGVVEYRGCAAQMESGLVLRSPYRAGWQVMALKLRLLNRRSGIKDTDYRESMMDHHLASSAAGGLWAKPPLGEARWKTAQDLAFGGGRVPSFHGCALPQCPLICDLPTLKKSMGCLSRRRREKGERTKEHGRWDAIQGQISCWDSARRSGLICVNSAHLSKQAENTNRKEQIITTRLCAGEIGGWAD